MSSSSPQPPPYATDSPAHRLFRVRRTVLQMLRDRGYVDAHDRLAQSADAFVAQYGGVPQRRDLTMHLRLGADAVAAKRADATRPTNAREAAVMVFFADDAKVPVRALREYDVRMRKAGVRRAIVVYIDKLTSCARAEVQRMAARRAGGGGGGGDEPRVHLECFAEAQLVFNITEHELVPLHELLSDAQKRAVLAHFRCDDVHMPRITLDDPVARYYGLRRGDMVRITRPSETAGVYTVYRMAS